jgi:hypothetical protein
MILLVNSAECWQYLPVKVNMLLSQCFWQLISDSWTCYRINSVPKKLLYVFRMTTNRGVYTHIPASTAFTPTTFSPRSAYLLPFLSSNVPLLPPSLSPVPFSSFHTFSSSLPLPLPILSLSSSLSLRVEAGPEQWYFRERERERKLLCLRSRERERKFFKERE